MKALSIMFNGQRIVTYEGFNKMLKDFWKHGAARATHQFVGVFGTCGITVGQDYFDDITDDDDILCLNRLLPK